MFSKRFLIFAFISVLFITLIRLKHSFLIFYFALDSLFFIEDIYISLFHPVRESRLLYQVPQPFCVPICLFKGCLRRLFCAKFHHWISFNVTNKPSSSLSLLRNSFKSFTIIMIIIIILLLTIFSHQREKLSDNESLQTFRTLLNILVDFNNVIVWMASIRLPISNFFRPFTKPFGIVPSAPIIIGITVTFMLHSFF